MKQHSENCTVEEIRPKTAYGISIWLQLNGGGKSYYADVKVEEAAAGEPVTDKGPGLNNLDFLETD